MQSALAMEKTVNQCLLDLHKVAESNTDAHVCSVLFFASGVYFFCLKMFLRSVAGVTEIMLDFLCAGIRYSLQNVVESLNICRHCRRRRDDPFWQH